MIAVTNGASFDGLLPIAVRVEVSAQKGLPTFDIVGMGQVEVKEGKQRIRSALDCAGVRLKNKKITVNLAPADVPKKGSLLDLPIALTVLHLMGMAEKVDIEKIVSFGELSLDGYIRPVKGGYAIAEELSEQCETMIVPARQTELQGECLHANIVYIDHIQDLIEYLNNPDAFTSSPRQTCTRKQKIEVFDFSSIRGQHQAKRMLMIAAAGKHHAMLAGPPGVGKTLLARAFPSIFPPLLDIENREVKKIYSAAGYMDKWSTSSPPLRDPHHHATLPGLVGGGVRFQAGDFMLAHNGVLFMDEFPEFRRDIIESLREPLQEGVVRVRRANGLYEYPAKFLLLAAMNLCPCGNLGDPSKECDCSPNEVNRYRRKLSRPIMDRIDLSYILPKISWNKVWNPNQETKSIELKAKVVHARNAQYTRWGSGLTNASIDMDELKSNGNFQSESLSKVQQIIDQQKFSVRSMVKVLRVARTIADLDQQQMVETKNILEAIGYRMREDL